MKTNTAMKFMVPKGWGVNEELMADGSREFTIKPNTSTIDDTACHQREDFFELVPASQLSLSDDFLQHIPQTENVSQFMREVKRVIYDGVHDFWHPICDPSFDHNGCICYCPGKKPAVGKSYNWWSKNAKAFCLERGSRLGTTSEYIAFMAVLIKELISVGKSAELAWYDVCNESKRLGHYLDSISTRSDFESTGSRYINGWYDLGNTYKILEPDKEGGCFWLAGGSYCDRSYSHPLAEFSHSFDYDNLILNGTGWLVLESCSDC